MSDQHAIASELNPLDRRPLLLAEAAFLLTRDGANSKLPVGYLQKVLIPAMQRQDCKAYWSGNQLIGLIIFASFSQDSESIYIENGALALRTSEWNDGNRRWIIEFRFLPGNFYPILRDLRRNVLRHFNAVRFSLDQGNELMHVELRHSKYKHNYL